MGTKQTFLVIVISTLVLIFSVMVFYIYTQPRREPQKIIDKNDQDQSRSDTNLNKNTSAEDMVYYNNPEAGLSFSYPKEWGEAEMPSYILYFTKNSKITIEVWPIEYAYKTKALRNIDSPSCLSVLNKPLLFKEERAALGSAFIKKVCASSYSLIPVDDPRNAQCEITSIGNPSQKTIVRWYEINPTCGEGSMVDGPIREVKSYTFYSPTQRLEVDLILKSSEFHPDLESQIKNTEELNSFDFLPYTTKQENIIGKQILNELDKFDEMVKTIRIIK